MEPSLTAKGLASNKWNLKNLKKLFVSTSANQIYSQSNVENYCTNQWGQLTAQVSIGSTVSNQDLNLLCMKSRSFGEILTFL